MNAITVSTHIQAPIERVWKCWTKPEHIQAWNAASDDWYTPHASNDLRVGGKFLARMEARDGSAGFDFSGTYTDVVPGKRLAYALDDGRGVEVAFTPIHDRETFLEDTFDAETEHSLERQRDGWQAILNRFKTYVENLNKNSSF